MASTYVLRTAMKISCWGGRCAAILRGLRPGDLLPERSTVGNQSLRFGLGVVDGRAHRLISDALDSGLPSYVVYREYVSTDTSAPAAAPKRMLIQGGDLNSNALQIEASYFDLLNLAWPRDRYTADKAPGVKYQ